MARRNTHPLGKPAGLSPPDLQRRRQPAAYLTSGRLPVSQDGGENPRGRIPWSPGPIAAGSFTPTLRRGAKTRFSHLRQVIVETRQVIVRGDGGDDGRGHTIGRRPPPAAARSWQCESPSRLC